MYRIVATLELNMRDKPREGTAGLSDGRREAVAREMIETSGDDIVADRSGAPPNQTSFLEDGGRDRQQPSAPVTTHGEPLQSIFSLPLEAPGSNCPGSSGMEAHQDLIEQPFDSGVGDSLPH